MEENNQNQEMNQNMESTSQISGEEKKLKNFSIASLVCGIVSVVTFCWWYISLPCAIVAIVLGSKSKGQKYSKAGKILGIIGIAIEVVLFIVGLVLGASLAFSIFSLAS